MTDIKPIAFFLFKCCVFQMVCGISISRGISLEGHCTVSVPIEHDQIQSTVLLNLTLFAKNPEHEYVQISNSNGFFAMETFEMKEKEATMFTRKYQLIFPVDRLVRQPVQNEEKWHLVAEISVYHQNKTLWQKKYYELENSFPFPSQGAIEQDLYFDPSFFPAPQEQIVNQIKHRIYNQIFFLGILMALVFLFQTKKKGKCEPKLGLTNPVRKISIYEIDVTGHIKKDEKEILNKSFQAIEVQEEDNLMHDQILFEIDARRRNGSSGILILTGSK